MTLAGEGDGKGAAMFGGRRRQLFWLLLRGYLLMLPTLGIYRFWLATQKRRFYWHNTSIDGDPLEYTGTAAQLLLGFLFAVAFFLPIYLAFFYFSTQSAEVAVLGYSGVALLFWYLTGYAIYRARDFRLSRTLWRGIRFDQRGSAWGYATRRFFWSILVVLTLGLTYPFMAGSLWRYRYLNSWYGDRQFGFTGSWKTVAGPFYLTYFGLLLVVIATFFIASAGPSLAFEDGRVAGWPALLALLVSALLVVAGSQYYRARALTRLFSSIRIGQARLAVKVTARALFAQCLVYGLSLLGVAALAAAVTAGVAGLLSGGVSLTGLPNGEEVTRFLQTGWVQFAVVALAYLSVIAALGLCFELVFGFGFWALVARDATVTDAETLRSVRAAAEDRAVIGEGLADALNVGSY